MAGRVLGFEQGKEKDRKSARSSPLPQGGAVASGSAHEEEAPIGEEKLPVEAGELSDEALAAAFDALHAKRLQWVEDGAAFEGNDFYTQLRGGGFTMKKAGVPFDSVMAAARRGAPAQWAKRYGMGQVAVFTLRAYEEAPCNAMALEWARKCQYYYNVYKNAQDEHYMYSDKDLADYRESPEFLAFCAELPEGHAAWKRIFPLRELAPINPT